MKGPFERLKYDLRRLWECPHCKRRERSDGAVTTRFCACPGKGVPDGQRTAMKLLEEAGHRAVPVIAYRPAEETPPSDPLEVAPPADKAPAAPETAHIVEPPTPCP
jgi:hypothetical protein